MINVANRNEAGPAELSVAERHLAQMEGKYRGLLEAAPDAMVVVNQAGQIVLLNVQAEKQFGYSRDELLGQQVKNLIPEGFLEGLIADVLRSSEDALAPQIGTAIELSGRRKDGADAVEFIAFAANCYRSKPVQLDSFETQVKSMNDFRLLKAKLPQHT